MIFHTEKHGIDSESWAVVGSDGHKRMGSLSESSARFYCDLLNARNNKTATP